MKHQPFPLRVFLCGLLSLLGTTCSRPRTDTDPGADPVASSRTARAAELRSRLMPLVGRYEQPVTEDELARLGEPDELTKALLLIYRDPSVVLGVRIQALASLRFFPGPPSRAALEEALLSPETTDAARRAAVKAYAWAFPQDSVPLLSGLLQHPEIHTREAAARSLAAIRTREAREALRTRLPDEPEPFIRDTIEAGLAR